jgi:hypothetical protein
LYIPKRELVAEVAIKLQTGKIKIAPTLAEAEILKEELKNFKCKISSSGHDTYGAGDDWRVGNHDDLVLATALALWTASRPVPGQPRAGGDRAREAREFALRYGLMDPTLI